MVWRDCKQPAMDTSGTTEWLLVVRELAQVKIGVGGVMSNYYTNKPSVGSINNFYHACKCRLRCQIGKLTSSSLIVA